MSSAFAAAFPVVQPQPPAAPSGRRAVTKHAAAVSNNNNSNNNNDNSKPLVFPDSDPPYLALITERNAVDSDQHLADALQALHAAVSTNQVDLVSVRVRRPDHNPAAGEEELSARQTRLTSLIHTLLDWSDDVSFRVVVTSDWMECGIAAGAHGIHFKEAHRDRIPHARALSLSHSPEPLLVGTSTHTVASAQSACEAYQPDYLFCGTCFETESHPEKTGQDLEGPAFPSMVRHALDAWGVGETTDKESSSPLSTRRRPILMAIGGMDETNCRAQVNGQYSCFSENDRNGMDDGGGVDGIATIRAVLQADDPAAAVRAIQFHLRNDDEDDDNDDGTAV